MNGFICETCRKGSHLAYVRLRDVNKIICGNDHRKDGDCKNLSDDGKQQCVCEERNTGENK